MVTFCYDESDRYLFVENVPAEVCKSCGEKTYSPEATDKLLRYAKTDVKPSKTIEVPVHEFT
ncbi:MAG: YgiT-type zinc finger protein [Candidatus Anammoxibacter sp.]